MKRFLGAVMFALFATAVLYGTSVEILPSSFSIFNVVPGKAYDLSKEQGIYIYIPNVEKDTLAYSLKVEVPSRALRGYYPIPSADFVKLDKNMVKRVAPGDTAKVAITLDIPDKPEYYNQAWEFDITVTRGGGISAAMVGISMSVIGRYLVETRPDEKKAKPFGKIALIPGAVFFHYMDKENPKQKKSVKIFNNDTTAHKYEVVLYVPKPQDPYSFHLDIDPVQGTLWTNEYVSVKPKKLTIKAGESKDVTLSVDFPKNYDKTRRSGAVIIKPEGELKGSRIIRFQLVP